MSYAVMSPVGDDRGPVRGTSDPREAMKERLPGWAQGLLTQFTGKAHTGQRPGRRRTAMEHFAVPAGYLVFGVWGACAAWDAGPAWWPLLPILFGFTVGGARHLQVNTVHECVHRQFTGYAVLDAAVAELVTTVLMIQDFWGYRADHLRHHMARHIASLRDPDMQFLYLLGIRPGMPRRELWRRLLWTVVSPRFHWLFLRARLRANFVTCPVYRRVMSVAWWAAVLGAVAYWDAWVPFAVCWALPMGPLYHVSALLQFTSEHRWGLRRAPGQTTREYYAAVSHGRFLGAAPPPRGLPLAHRTLAWVGWAGRMAGHGYVRLAVVVADLPVHDDHHRNAGSPAWPDAIYERQRKREAGGEGWPDYTDVWGLKAAIDRVFATLSRADPVPPEVARKVMRPDPDTPLGM